MGMWEILEEGRDDYGRGFGMRGDEAHLCKHIKCYLDDIDGDPCRAFDEFFATCIGKGIPVIWSDVI